jgi:putative transcriptional regulator
VIGEVATPVRHHPREATLVAHAAGILGPTAGLVVDAHLARCAGCRATLRLAMELGGALLAGLPATPLAPDAWERVMERIDEQARAAPGDEGGGTAGEPAAARTPPAAAAAVELPAALRGLLRSARLRWLAPGVRHAVLLRERGGGGGTLRLLRVRPGTALPRHGHRGAELTCVLEGAFSDEEGRYGPGDLAEAGEDTTHRPIAEGLADCVCLVATEGRLRFGGPLGALFGAVTRL